MPREAKPVLTHPGDFEAFWEKTSHRLNETDPALHREPISQDAYPHLQFESLSFVSLGEARVHGYLVRWKDSLARPLVIHSHGYNSECTILWPWAAAGLNVLGVDIRGFGRSHDAVPVRSKWGYMLTGIDSPENHVLRGAICDYVRAVDVGQHILGPQVQRTILHGMSFAGGLALMAEGVLQVADLLVIGVPTFGWAEGRQFFVKSGSGAEINEYLQRRHEHAEDLMVVLRYFDPINFAGSIQCPTLVGVGLKDDVVPPETVYAIANHLAGPHEVMEFPVSHSDAPEERLWVRFTSRWLRLALNGVPADFGKIRHPPREG